MYNSWWCQIGTTNLLYYVKEEDYEIYKAVLYNTCDLPCGGDLQLHHTAPDTGEHLRASHHACVPLHRRDLADNGQGYGAFSYRDHAAHVYCSCRRAHSDVGRDPSEGAM